MTIREAIESYRRNVDCCKQRLEIDRLRMEPAEIKEMQFYIERDELAIRSLEAWEELKSGVYKLHPAKRGDTDYANGVYDGECYVINYVTDFINRHLSEAEGEE